MNKNKFNFFLRFLLFVICFVCIPIAMVFTGYYYTFQRNKKNCYKNITRKVSSYSTRLEQISDSQSFWYYLFKKNIVENTLKTDNITKTVSLITNKLEKLNKNYDFDYVVYHPKLGFSSKLHKDTLGGNEKEQKEAINVVYKYRLGILKSYSVVNEEILGKVFGPQFYIAHVYLEEANEKGLKLCWTDSLYKRSLIWNSVINKCLVMTFINIENLHNINYIKKYLDSIDSDENDSEKDSRFFTIRENDSNSFLHSINDDKKRKEIELASYICDKDCLLEIETDNYYIFPKFLRPGITVYDCYDKSKLVGLEPSFYWKLGIIFSLVFGLIITVYGFRILILHKLDNISIKWKLGFLFFFANGLPLLVLIFIGNDYISQAYADYIQKIIKEGTSFLQDFDAKYELEYARCLIRKEKYKLQIIKDRKNNLLKAEDVELLYNGVSSDTWALFIIGSQSQVLVRNSDGVFDDNDLKKTPDGKYLGVKKLDYDASDRFETHFSGQIQFAQKLGNFLLNRFNNQPISEKSAAEIELMAESALRKKLDYFIFEAIEKLGNFTTVGLGRNIFPAIMDSLSLFDDDYYDYFVLLTLRIGNFQENYLKKSIIQANRNELGLKVVVFDSNNKFYPIYEKTNTLDEFRKGLSPYPIEEPIILKHKGEEYICMGFECKHLERCKIMGLYPLDKINRSVATRRNELIFISLISVLVTIVLSSILIRSFLNPLAAIYSGAKSIEQKNFQHRLPELGRDEFGAMGKIFNNVMVDLEELSVAGAIQEQLLPNSTIKTGFFSLYGKSVPMGAMGGDYFDFIEMEDNKFSVALGDVAGHGVGASLIMAMAKSGLITLDFLWTEPKKLIEKLHEMVYKSKTQNQRKIMTFQYLYVDGNTGQAVFSNAGGCTPVIVRKNANIVEEAKLPGAVLGAFKRGRFTETNIQFEKGDAIIFYTDGMVECKDNNGEMLGYDRLKILFQNSWNEDSEIFYKNIYKSYLDYIGGDESKAGDDVTVVVLVFNKPEAIDNLIIEEKEEKNI